MPVNKLSHPRLLGWRTGVCVLAAAVTLASCASMEQTEDEVYLRHSGSRLAPWKTVAQAAAIHGPIAWAATAAYQDSDDPHRKPLETSPDCPEPHAYLAGRGWVLWEELPLLRPRGPQTGSDAAAVEQVRDAHLRVQVWSNAAQRLVVVAFGGTAASSLQDWKANLRWLLAPFGVRDAYDVLTDTYVPLFVDAYRKRAGGPGGDWLTEARLVGAGHSLGGGLAQRFAYSLAAGQGVPAVKEVYAFDPSPVSGKRSVEAFEQQAKGLTIYRIYNRGETLASLRSILQMGDLGEVRSQGQTWIDIRYRSGWTWRTLLPTGTVAAHSMRDLACFMKRKLDAAGEGGEVDAVLPTQ
jgi:hypothetical protein